MRRSHRSTDDVAPTLLTGHSLGGAAVLAAAWQIDAVRTVATIGTPAESAYSKRRLGDKIELIREHGEIEVQLVGRPFHIHKQFLDDLNAIAICNRVHNLGRPFW